MALKYHRTSRGEVAFEKRGLGDPLLLVHALYAGASHHEFDHNIQELARHFTVYALDLLGYGDSDMPRLTYSAQIYHHLLRDFIVEVIGSPAHVVASGTSCGFAVLAVYNDTLVNKLVLIDPQIDGTPTDAPPTLASKVQQFLLGTLAMGKGLYETVSTEFELRRFLHSRYASAKRVTEQQVSDLHERASRRHAMHAFLSLMTGHLSIEVPRWLRYVRNEVLVVWGSDAGPAPAEQLLLPAAWSRGKRLEIVAGAAHWPHDEQSARTNTMIEQFLDGNQKT